MRLMLLTMGWLAGWLPAVHSFAQSPTNNPVAAFYNGPVGYPAWTDQIHWERVINMAAYANGTNTFHKFENACEELAAQGGGVLYYPAGTYDFSAAPMDGPNGRGLMLRSGVVIRGQSPSGDADARDGTLDLPTKFVFGMQTKGGGKVPRDWNIIGLKPGPGERIKDVHLVGICWVHVTGATVFFGPDMAWGTTWGTAGAWKSPYAKPGWVNRVADGTHPADTFCGAQNPHQYLGTGTGRLVFGCKFDDAAVLNDFMDEGGNGGFYMYKFGPRLGVYGSRVFVANNTVPASTNNFKYTQQTCTPANINVCTATNCSAVRASTILWDYGKNTGIDNKDLLGLVMTGFFEEGVVVRDNFIFNHGHKGLNLCGQYVTIQSNRNERVYLQEGDNPYGLGSGWELTLDGWRESTAGGNGCNSDNLSRALDLAGRALWIDGNSFNNTGSNPGNDGEGILCQAAGGTQLFSWAVTRNTHTLGSGEAGYFGGYDVNNYGCLIAWNTNPGTVGNLKAGNLYDAAFVTNITAGTTITTNGIVDVLTNCPAAALSPPLNVAAVVSNDFVIITWSDSTSAEIGYRVQRSIASGPWFTIAYRPRRGVGTSENLQRWHDYTAPSNKPLQYRVVAVNCADNDTGASAATSPVTITLTGGGGVEIDPWSVGPVAADWEAQYQFRLDNLINGQSWSICAGNADQDDGKRCWPALLAEMWKARTNSTALTNYINNQGNTLIFSTWAGQFFKAFTEPGYTFYYYKFREQLPTTQLSKVTNMLYTARNNSTPCCSFTETGWQMMQRTDGHMDPIYPETEFNSENFNWMARLAGVLLARTHEPSLTNYFNGYLNNWIRALFHAGRVEWNSNNYFGYTFNPVLVLHEFAPDLEAKRKAKAALDWMALETALHYLDGFQAGPDVRAKDNAFRPFAGSAWPFSYLYFVDAANHPTYTTNAAAAAMFRDMVGIVPWSSYRPPQAVIDIAQRKFTLPVEMRNAKPFYHLDNDNYADWAGNTARSRRFEFETVYYDDKYLLASLATYRPDGAVGTFSEQSVWRLAVKGTTAGSRQMVGNAGNFATMAGRCPQEEIGQYRNVMMRLLKGADNMWIAVTNAITVEITGTKAFADLGQGVYVALLATNATGVTSNAWSYDGTYRQVKWTFPTNQVGALVMEVGVARDFGNYAAFKTQINSTNRFILPGAEVVEYTAVSGRKLKMEYQPTTNYTLVSGQVISPAGVVPKVWADGQYLDYSTWPAYGVSHGQNIVSQPWGSGMLTLGAGSNGFSIVVDPASAAVSYRTGELLPVMSIVASNPNAAEPNVPGAFTVTRTGDASVPVTVNYTVTGTASNGMDYLTLSGTLTLPAGSNSVVVTVTLLDDALYETDETVMVTLLPSTGYSLGVSAATVTIADDDPPPAFQQDSGAQGLVVFEVENYDAKVGQGGHEWTANFTAGHSGSGAMQALPNSGANVNSGYTTNSPRMDYVVNFTKTGTHYVWMRGWGATGSDDSCHVGLDGAAVATSDRVGGFTNDWTWTKSTMDSVPASFTVGSVGLHTVNVWMREDGLILDKVLLTTDAGYTPTGLGPAESGCATEFDLWRTTQFTAAELADPNISGATADVDGDGRTNYEEFLAGTSPKDPGSVFHISRVTGAGQFRFPTVVGKLYSAQRCTDIKLGDWSTFTNNIPGTGSESLITDPTAASGAQRFYRVFVQP
jgi:hypothetical protein